MALTDVGEVAKAVSTVTNAGMTLHKERKHAANDEAAKRWKRDWDRAVVANDADAMAALLEQQRLARLSNGSVG